MAALKGPWDIPDDTLQRFIEVCRSVSKGAGLQGANFDELLNAPALRAIPRDNIHVLIGILGFSFGGGEIFDALTGLDLRTAARIKLRVLGTGFA